VALAAGVLMEALYYLTFFFTGVLCGYVVVLELR
jgi:hypothetical protein